MHLLADAVHDERLRGVRLLPGTFRNALILENPDPSLDAQLRAQGIEPDRLPEAATQDRDFVVRRLAEVQHEIIFKRSRFEVDAEVVDASERLAAVMLCCIGDDSVDKAACAARGVMVMNDPVSNSRSVVEMVFGELICMARRIFDANDAGRTSLWTKDNRQRYELKGKTLSVIGLGNIGKQVAQMAEAFGMDVVFFDRNVIRREVGLALDWQAADSLDEAFRLGDFVTLHLSAEDPAGRSNRGLITFEHFQQIGAERGENSPRLFVNAARGFLYDPQDLKRAVEEGYVQAAAVDVFPEEPGSKRDQWENPYADHPRQIVTTPHIGAATQEAQPRIARRMAATARLFHTLGTVRDTPLDPKRTIGISSRPPFTVLSIVHADVRGTRKAITDTVYEAGADTMETAQHDFKKHGIAYEVMALDQPLGSEAIAALVQRARDLSGTPDAIRSIRQFTVEG
jgi:D-3-phosphoglycerate dehydrogenase